MSNNNTLPLFESMLDELQALVGSTITEIFHDNETETIGFTASKNGVNYNCWIVKSNTDFTHGYIKIKPYQQHSLFGQENDGVDKTK